MQTWVLQASTRVFVLWSGRASKLFTMLGLAPIVQTSGLISNNKKFA